MGPLLRQTTNDAPIDRKREENNRIEPKKKQPLSRATRYYEFTHRNGKTTVASFFPLVHARGNEKRRETWSTDTAFLRFLIIVSG